MTDQRNSEFPDIRLRNHRLSQGKVLKMQRRAAEESLTDHGKDNSNGRAHVGDAIRHKPGILGFLRQIGFMRATVEL